MSRLPARTASFIITFLGATSNLAVALQILAAWRSFKWEPESEWESSGDKWAVDGIKVIWGILLTYFSAASLVSAIGFAGIVKSKPAFVKFYRDYSIADFAFCAFITLVIGYASSLPSAPVGVCEGLARQPELMRDMAETGLSPENCERWFKRAVFAMLSVMLIVLVARLHFLLAVGIYYSHLSRHSSQRGTIPMTTTSMSHPHTRARSSPRSRSCDSVQRVYLLPRNVSVPGVTMPTSPLSSNVPASATTADSESEDIVMYAPVPMHSLSREEALDLRRNATETWVKSAKVEGEKSARMSHSRAHSYTHSHRHRHHHSQHTYSHSAVMNGTGQISLPVLPDEGLLPEYTSEPKEA